MEPQDESETACESAPRTESQNEPRTDEQQLEFVRQLTHAHHRLLGYLMSLVGNRYDAEDVLQLASMQMWRQYHTFQPGTDFVAWASTIAYYQARNFLRVSGRARVSFHDELLAQIADKRQVDLGNWSRRVEALMACMERLDGAARHLVLSVYGEDIAINDLANQLGRPVKTLYNRLYLIRRALEDCMDARLRNEAAT
jgi:RNA polymerase sigma-70 factor (ECF subfamily)